MAYSYISRTALKSRLGDSLTTDDAIYRAVLEAVSVEIDRMTARTFQPYSATLYYSAMNGELCLVDDLLTLTTLKTYKTSARDSQDTWTSSDYDLYPFNATTRREPYTFIKPQPDGDYVFPTFTKGVEVVGVFGYWLDTLSVTTLSAAISSTSATTCTVTSAANIEPLMTLLIDSEQLYVTAVNGTTLTVERGMNGTTAATHLISTAVSLYRYPSPIVEATMIQAARQFRRKDAPFGIEGTPDFGQTPVIPRLDPDVRMLTRPYVRHHFGAV